MYNLGKIIEDELILFNQPNFILGDATNYALENGFKHIINKVGYDGIYEDDRFIYVETPPNPPKTNEEIKIMREEAYKQESDSLFIAYNKYLLLGLTDKAEELKNNWFNKINEINERFPYII